MVGRIERQCHRDTREEDGHTHEEQRPDGVVHKHKRRDGQHGRTEEFVGSRLRE